MSVAAGTLAALAAVAWLTTRRSVPSVADKLVVITAGLRGSGLELAREFAQAGGRVVVLTSDREELERAMVGLHDSGIAIEFRVCNLTRREAVRRTILELQSTHGPIDVLVNNAGLLYKWPQPS